jgi:hypothetical protein
MSPIVVVVVLAVVTGLLSGGSLRRFEHARLHWWGAALAALALQAVPALPPLSLLVSYACLLAFVLVNRRVAGTALMFAGLALNLAVIAPNGGMPVDPSALEAVGGEPAVVAGGKHHLREPDDVLAQLGDVIPLPPLKAVISVGDVVLYAGVGWFVVFVMLGRTRENRRPPARWLKMYRGKHEPFRLRMGRAWRPWMDRSPLTRAAEAGRWGTAR